ncbi:MAG: Ig-like domain-containing protein [Fibrobacterales bacterium]
MKQKHALLLLVTLVLLVACAHVVPLTGGEPDKQKPYITGIYPNSQSTKVPRELQAVFQFSEWINDRPNDFKKAVTISPPLNKLLKFEVDGDRLMITSNATLDSNTTYNLVLSTEVQDLNGNQLISPFNLTFSTGDTIDTLELAGSVQYPVGSRGKMSSIKIGLYPTGEQRSSYGYLSEFADSNGSIDPNPNFFEEKPLYITGSDSSGLFLFKGLKKGTYELIAFEDQNNNAKVNLPSEKVALSSGPLIIGDSSKPSLTLVSQDTNKLKLTGIEIEYPNRLIVNFNKPPYKDEALVNTNYTIMSLDSSSTYPVQSIYLQPNSNYPVLTIDSLAADSSYFIVCTNLHDSLKHPLDSARRFTQFTWRPIIDTLPPRVVTTQPKARATDITLDTAITLFYNKPVALEDFTYQLVAAEDTLPFVATQKDPLTITITPNKELPNNTEAVVSYLTSDTLVIEGDSTQPADTTITERANTVLSFNTYKVIKLSQFSGVLPGDYFTSPNKGTSSAVITIQNQTTKNIYSTQSTDGTFAYNAIPEGPYFLEYYIDNNKNSQWDAGSIYPLGYSEPYHRIKDTLHIVRSETNNLQTLLIQLQDTTSTLPKQEP